MNGGGFTYVPNANDCVKAGGAQESAVMAVYYAGSQEKWDSFAADNNLWLGDAKVICGK